MTTLKGFLISVAGKKVRLWAVAVLLCTCAALSTWYFDAYTDLTRTWQKRESISELRELPLGAIKVRGVVTYVDNTHKRFWLQDESGAIAVTQDPRLTNLHFGDAVQIEMKKTHAFDPIIGITSLGLNDFQVTKIRNSGSLPVPAKATISALSEETKNGIRVTVEGVVHGYAIQPSGWVRIDIGDGHHEIQAIVPSEHRDYSQLINATVLATGVVEVKLDDEGNPTFELLWVQNGADLKKIGEPPISTPFSSSRYFYAHSEDRNAHMVRLRGRVLYQESADSLIVEDEWGAISCKLEKPGVFEPGTAVEVRAFQIKDGLRVDLMHGSASPSPTEERSIGAELHVSLSSIAAIRALPANVIRTSPPVKAIGVITYLDTNYRQLFIQDSTAGIFIKYPGSALPIHRGDRISVTGMAHEGDFAPVIVAPKIISMGPATFPKPTKLNLQARSGVLDSLFGEAEGVVHPTLEKQSSDRTTFYLYTALGPIHIGLDNEAAHHYSFVSLQDATVKVRGVMGEVFNSRRQIIGLQMSVSASRDIEIIEPGTSNPFTNPAVPISELLKYSPHARPDHRTVISGAVTMLGNGFVYIQDHTGGVRIESDTSGVHLHEVIDAAGYATATGYSPVLTDAVIKPMRMTSGVEPHYVTADMLGDGQFDSQLVSIDATLLSVENSSNSRTLSVTSGGHTFPAVLYLTDTGQPFTPPQNGSLLRLAGICSVELGRQTTDNLFKRDPVAFRLMVRSSSDIKILSRGSWWTTGRSLAVIAMLVLAVLLSAARIFVLLRRIERDREELRKASEKEGAIRQLISAMHTVRVEKQFNSRVSLPEADELASIGKEFNHMVEELRVRDIAMAQAEEKLQQQAHCDALTGLPNRRLFSDRISQSIAVAKREDTTVGMLYIDLDGFKLVNDSFGHNFGDQLLIQVSQRIAARIRKSDTLSRLGGDEFAVVLNNLKAVEHAETLAKSLLHVIAKPFVIDGQEITIGASIGICVFPDHANSESELVQFADSAMYSAKRSGKNRVVLYTQNLGESVRERLTIENQLRRAIADGEILIHYQPEFVIGSSYPIRFEALARWTHPTLGSIPPVKFIPIAEESGLIIPLGAYILEMACKACASWQSKSRTPIAVAVNVSNVQFVRESFVEEVETILKTIGLDPSLLQLELTESVMMNGVESAVATIRRLQSIGVSVAIDDFGTGYSALSYLSRLPFNSLKIDRTFMKDIMQSPETKAMVHSVIVLAQELGMNVIVEGIENEEQLKAIEEIGANEVQGFSLGRPTPDPAAYLSVSDPSVEEAEIMNDQMCLVAENLSA